MTKKATSLNESKVLTENPLHNMSGLRKHIGVPGKLLPKHLLRPFSYQLGTSIDDKEYTVVSYSSWKDNLEPPYIIAYAISAILGFSCITARCNIIELQLIPICLLAFAMVLHRAYWRYQNNHTCYSRRTGIVRYEFGLLRLKQLELPFRECEGRLVSTSNLFGLVWHRLILTHPAYRKSVLLLSSRSFDEVLGYWSVIVKYMDSSGELPDIWPLNRYPNREKGFGGYEQWLDSLMNREVEDPFNAWQYKLKQHPELDWANLGRNHSYHGLIETWMGIRNFIVFSVISGGNRFSYLLKYRSCTN